MGLQGLLLHDLHQGEVDQLGCSPTLLLEHCRRDFYVPPAPALLEEDSRLDCTS